MTSIRLPEELETRLEKLALENKRSKSFYIREALESYLEELEDLARAEKILSSNKKFISLEKIEAKYGLED